MVHPSFFLPMYVCLEKKGGSSEVGGLLFYSGHEGRLNALNFSEAALIVTGWSYGNLSLSLSLCSSQYVAYYIMQNQTSPHHRLKFITSMPKVDASSLNPPLVGEIIFSFLK